MNVHSTSVLNVVSFRWKMLGKSSCASICHPYDCGSEMHSFQKYLWAHDVLGKKRIKHNPSNSYNQGCLYDLWGPVQNENMKPIKNYENFQGDNSSTLRQARGGVQVVKGSAAAEGRGPGWEAGLPPTSGGSWTPAACGRQWESRPRATGSSLPHLHRLSLGFK